MITKKHRTLISLILIGILISIACTVYAGSPSGADTFELTASPFTGGDNTGDGGTGNPNDLNYYYVGQLFTTTMRIVSGTGSNGADLWIDYDTNDMTASGLNTGSFFSNWVGQSIAGGRIKSSAYNNPGQYSSGAGNYGTVNFQLTRPTAANYGTGAPETLDINVGVIGNTTESNISRDGVDVLDDEEDFQFHIWADTKKPYAENPNPANTAVNVAVESNYTFDLRDSKNGEGDNSGVGTGVNTATPPGAITANDGTGAIDYTPYDSYACSGVWGTNLCATTLNPPSPLGIAGDTRSWKYSTLYTVIVSNFQDLASPAQNQLGDTNGPNTMDTKTWTFTTEDDTVAPRVTNETPARGSVSVPVDTNITVEITDRKTYPNGPSGTGVNSATCDINVSSPSFPLKTFHQGDPEVTITAINYGIRFAINPATDFGQNEVVSVRVFNCQDKALAPNTMVTDNYTFTTTDSDPPYVDTLVPADNTSIPADSNISFHIKDDGTGVDLANTVIYLNGTYYTNGGGAGSVTINGTKITFATSLDYNGGNYAGDTTNIAGAATDFTFTINPENNFPAGSVIPLIIYATDNSGNLMERAVYGFTTTGSSCSSGSTYCGTNTTWNGTTCTGTGGGSGGSSGGDCHSGNTAPFQAPKVKLAIDMQSITQIDENSVLVSWHSSMKGNSAVAYSDTSSKKNNSSPKYGYQNITEKHNDNSIYHSVVISELETGKLYYFKPITYVEKRGYITGEEQVMALRFAKKITEYIEKECPIHQPEQKEKPQPKIKPKPKAKPKIKAKKTIPYHPKKPILKVNKVERSGKNVKVWGKAAPLTKIKITIH